MGAVVDGVPSTFQIPDSGQASPVRALVPMGFLEEVIVPKISKHPSMPRTLLSAQ